MEPLDWGEGQYARTAVLLAPASEAVIDLAGVSPGDRVLDMACGTGNAALAAVARGATATGIDISPALIAQAVERAAAAGRAGDCAFLVGDAVDPPVERGAFDVAVSVFGVIFAPDPDAAIGGMRDSLRPGGTLAISTWTAGGPVHEVACVLRKELPREDGSLVARWEDRAWVAGLMTRAGLRDVVQREEELVWSAASAAAWFAEQEENHPVWRWARRLLPAERWDAVRDESIVALRAGSDDPDAFRAPGPYVVTRAVV